MRVIIEVSKGKHAGKHRTILPGQTIKVGRSDWADFACPWDPAMSSEHFQLKCEKAGCILTDLGSRNGTFVNGQPSVEVLIDDQDDIDAGETSFRISLTGGSRKQATSTFDLNFVDRPNDSAVMRGFKGRLGGEFQTSAGPGWHKSWSDTATVQPHVLAQLLRKDQSLFLVVDRRRTGVVLPDELKEVHYLWTSLPPEAAAQVSPVVLSAGTNLEWVSVAMDAWGSDGLLYVLATDSPENVLESLRAACRADDPNSIVGFCWPSIAARLLELPDISHQPALDGVAALLCEQADDPQTWLLFTRDDPVQLLTSFGMKQAEGQAGEKDATGQLAASGGPAR